MTMQIYLLSCIGFAALGYAAGVFVTYHLCRKYPLN